MQEKLSDLLSAARVACGRAGVHLGRSGSSAHAGNHHTVFPLVLESKPQAPTYSRVLVFFYFTNNDSGQGRAVKSSSVKGKDHHLWTVS